MNKIKIFAIVCLLITTTIIKADDDGGRSSFNPLVTGVPSLTIAPDARGGAMGDVGVSTEADMVSQYWNPAKYAFAYSKAGVSLSYTPWLRSLVDDIDLVYLSGFFKLGDTDRHAIGASLRYFSLGQVDLTYDGDLVGQSINPYEMAVDVSYSLKFSETFSGAAAFRYIYSDMGAGVEEMEAGQSFAADIAGYYNNYLMIGNSECLLGLGFNISNIGSKISYDGGNHSTFIPTNLRIGGSLLFPLDDYNTMSISLEANKYLVPSTPDYEQIKEDAENAAIAGGASSEDASKAGIVARDQARDDYNAISPISGIFKSFNDAPGGMKEELQEITWSVGAEYAYNNQFFVRGGYFYENPNKGNRQYFSLGAGFKLTAFQLDVAYLISTVPSNPLDQTLRFSLSFDMDGLKGLMR